nr:hypothetical protein [Tissierella sp.]
MEKTTEEQIIDAINKSKLKEEESIDLIENLYWADWALLKEEYPDKIEEIFDYIKDENLTNIEISKVLKLYNNLDGAYIREFSDIILKFYKRDKLRFIKSLSLESDETINLVYLFRDNDMKVDEDEELIDISKSTSLSQAESDTIETFMKMYKTVCST